MGPAADAQASDVKKHLGLKKQTPLSGPWKSTPPTPSSKQTPYLCFARNRFERSCSSALFLSPSTSVCVLVYLLVHQAHYPEFWEVIL